MKIALKDTEDWYTYTPLKHKPKNLILKRVFGDYDENDVKTYVDNLNLPTVKVLKVIKYMYDKSNTNLYHFIVQIEHTSIAKDLMAETFICYQKVKWGWFRKNKIFQCRKCQRVGHASINCHFARRCVKCGEAHGKEECKIPKNADRNLLKCVNCRNIGHPASYYGCPYLKYSQNQLNIQRNNNKINLQKKIETAAHKIIPRNLNLRKTTPQISSAQSVSDPIARFPQLPRKHNLNIPPPATVTNDYTYNRNTEPLPDNNTNNLQAQINEVLIIVKQQHQLLIKQLPENSSRINYIFDHFEMN